MKSTWNNRRRQSNIKSSKVWGSPLVVLSASILLMVMAILASSIGAVATLVPVAASINLVKLTNGTDNDSAPGVVVPVGSTVTFTYLVTNPGTEALSGVTVSDNNGTPGVPGDDFNATFVSGDPGGNGLLDTSETWTFTASRIATPGQYTNIGTASGTGTVSAANVSDTNPENHFGAIPAINLVKLTNGTDNDSAPGIHVPVGSTVTFTYLVTNPGNVPLSGVTVSDNNGTPGVPGDDFNATFVSGDPGGNGLLDTSETWTFTASRIATPGQYTNIGTASGTPPPGAGPPVSDTNPDNHFGGSSPNVFGVDTSNNLVRFNIATPGTIVSSVPIVGLAGGETVLGIDFRPATGQLYALGSTSRLYIIDYMSNPGAAVATPVGNPGAFTLNGTEFGFDFNPTVDRIRVTSSAGQNLRLNPNDGSLVDFDTATPGIQADLNLAYDNTTADGDPIDVNAGDTPVVAGSAYTNSTNGAPTTTLYDIDTLQDTLVIQSPPNEGVLNTVGPLGVNADPSFFGLGFDIRGATNTAYASMVVGFGPSSLYSINLSTGAATLIGAFGGAPIRALAIPNEGFGNSTLIGTTATFNGGTACEEIKFDQSGGILRHNRYSAGDPGFASDFDFDPLTPGDQTLSATDPAVTIIVNAGGCDDRITIGSATAPASGLAASFQINGQGGGDYLTVDNSTGATPRTMTLNGTTSSITGLGGPISYGTLERLTVNAGTGGDTINIQGNQAALTSVFAGGGDDTVVFGNGASLFEVNNGGVLDGGGGTNTLDYSAYTTQVNVNMLANNVFTLFLATLSGAQEPGPLSTSPASGTLIASLSESDTTSILLFNIFIQGITGATVTGNHFHNAPAGVNGPIVRGLTPAEQIVITPPNEFLSGSWSSTDPPGIGGVPSSGPLTPALITELLANRIYFNTHTNLFPSGEARGQLINQGAVNGATGTGGVRSFTHVTGGSAGDNLIGNSSANILRGGPGDDFIAGGPGGDQMFGEAGNDTLNWNDGDGSDFMEGGADNDTVQVLGSDTAGDQFLIQVNPADPTRLRFDRTNLGLFNLNIGTTEALRFSTLDGDDTTTVEYAGGNPIPPGISGGPGLNFSGGSGPDWLVLQRSAGSFSAASETYTATNPFSGDITLGGSLIRFSAISGGVNDTVPVTNFTFTATAASPALNIINGPVVSGFNTTQINDLGTGSFPLINLANKTNVTANSGTGSQLINVNNPTAATGLLSLTVNGNAGSDTFNVKASTTVPININGNAPVIAPGDTLNYDTEGRTVSGDTTPPDGTINSPGVQPVNFTSIEAANLSGVPLSISDVSVTEGNSGSLNAIITVTLPSATSQVVTVDYATGNGTATTPGDYTGVSGTLTFAPGQTSRTITVPINGDTTNEADETFFVNLSNVNNATLSDNQIIVTILNDDAPTTQLSSSNYSFNEGSGHATITVTRAGELIAPAIIDYQTSDASGLANCDIVTGNASARCDYTAVGGTLSFAAGESSKTFDIPIINDVYVEGPETFTVTLSNPTSGALGTQFTSTVTITDDDLVPGAPNPIDNTEFFVRQHYLDFLGREPDPASIGWINQINNCVPVQPSCDRLSVSQGIYNSPEFRDRGYFIYKFYSVAFGRKPTYDEFMRDRELVSGFLSNAELEQRKLAFIAEFMSRAEFVPYNTLNDNQYVQALFNMVGLTQITVNGVIVDVAAMQQSMSTGKTRAQVLREIVESPEVSAKFLVESTVVMHYFGYLRRDPDAAYQDWINIFNQTGDSRNVTNGFVNSTEYRMRFGPA